MAMAMYWNGKPVEDLTPEERLEAIRSLGNLVDQYRGEAIELRHKLETLRANVRTALTRSAL